RSRRLSLASLAGVSRHSTGTAVDLTLVQADRPAAAPFDPGARYAPCVAAAAARAPDDSIDMGTGYDCFDVSSQTRNPAVAAEAKRWRTTLVALMTTHAFPNYHPLFGQPAAAALRLPHAPARHQSASARKTLFPRNLTSAQLH